MILLIHLTNQIPSIVSDLCLDTPNLGLVLSQWIVHSTRRLVKALSVHKVERTYEIEKYDIIDPFDNSNPFNRVLSVSRYTQPWIGCNLHVDH